VAHRTSHISDQDLLLHADGELSGRRAADIRSHLADCGSCRARVKKIEGTIADFVRAYRDSHDAQLPPAHASRVLLKTRLSQLAREHQENRWWRARQLAFDRRGLAYVACAAVVAFAVTMVISFRQPSGLSPDPRLTPGATLPLTETELCMPQPAARFHAVSASVGKRVFEEYGIRNPQPRRYELDYLIDPELGGSDDTRNLWPQPYSAVWNARVKDALEDHLRELVCAGKIRLAQAQHDISGDWISAYKRYFGTDRPISDHLAFMKDQPWE
jgi:hypothetical protein